MENMTNPEYEPEPFYYNERVDVVNQKDAQVVDAQIISIRGNILVVRYTNTNEEENIHVDDGLILKQWKPGKPFRRFNRIDVKNSQNNQWSEAVILELGHDKIFVKYKSDSKIIEEWINKDSKNIANVGKYSGKFNPNLHTSEEVNGILSKKKKFFKATENQEKKFREEMKTINLKIKEIGGDGNCLYRAISDQVYGTENYFNIVKSKCMDYLELEKDFFSQFMEGGKDKFEEYIVMKRMDGVWGDDIEIQAMSEIYNRPVEIYSHSKEPLKTFHETSGGFKRGYERETANKNNPIRISYHGRAHYNSLIPVDNVHQFKHYLIKTLPGEYENTILEKVKIKLIQEKEKPAGNTYNNMSNFNNINSSQININIENNEMNKNEKAALEFSRENFLERRLKDLDMLLEEKLATSPKNSGNIPHTNLSITHNNYNEVIKQSEYFETDQDLLKSIIEESKKEIKKEDDLTRHPSILFALELGFTTEEAILAYSAVGDDPDLMLQYLYSMQMN